MDGNDEIRWLEGIVATLFSAFSALFWWLWGNLVEAVKQQRNDLNDHKLDVAKNYVNKPDFRDTVIEMKDTAKRTHERLDDIANGMTEIKSSIAALAAVSGAHKTL